MGNEKEEKKMVDSQSGNCEIIQDDEMNLYDLWKVIVKRKMIIVAIFLISLLGAAIYCFTAPSIYRLETHAKLSLMPKELMQRELTQRELMQKELLTAKDISSIIGKIDREKKAVIFLKNADEITDAKIDEIKGTTDKFNDKFKITIESRNRENLPAALHEMITYIENIREIKSNYEKNISEFDERIKNVKEADKKNDFQVKEIEKRLSSAKLLPVGFNPIEINIKSIDLKMEKYHLEQERQKYKPIQALEDPFISKYPVKPKEAMIMIIAGICSLMFGIFVAFVAEYFEKARKKKHYQ